MHRANGVMVVAAALGGVVGSIATSGPERPFLGGDERRNLSIEGNSVLEMTMTVQRTTSAANGGTAFIEVRGVDQAYVDAENAEPFMFLHLEAARDGGVLGTSNTAPPSVQWELDDCLAACEQTERFDLRLERRSASPLTFSVRAAATVVYDLEEGAPVPDGDAVVVELENLRESALVIEDEDAGRLDAGE